MSRVCVRCGQRWDGDAPAAQPGAAGGICPNCLADSCQGADAPCTAAPAGGAQRSVPHAATRRTPDSLVQLLVRLTGAVGPTLPDADRAAWAGFVDLYTPLLYYWARRLGLQEADALDLVQDVLLHLYQKLPQFRYDPARNFHGWLRTVFLNKWSDRQRRAAVPLTPDPDRLQQLAAADPLDAVAEADHRRQLVRLALQLMQTDFERPTWQAFWEVAVHGRPPAAVAAELGLSVAAVYKAVARVRRRLRAELEGLTG